MRQLCPAALFTAALFTLACQGAPATNAGDAGKPTTPAPPATPAAPATPAKPTTPAADPHGDPHAGLNTTPVVRPPVNPGPVTPSGQVRAETIAELSFSVPTEWIRKPASNSMRLAEFTLPGPGGEVTLVVSRFAGGGGDAASNVNRWKTQLTNADGSPIADAKEKISDRAPLKITTVDIAGTNVATVTPMSQERFNEPNSRLLGVIVEGVGDPIFFKAVGAAQTVDVWAPAFQTFADSLAPTGK